MGKKIAFFDIDGTIYDFKNGIKDDTKHAIRQFIADGNYACLCTGRSRVRIYDDIFLNFGIQGVIAACGTYSEWQGKVLENYTVSKTVACEAAKSLSENGFVAVMEGPQCLYYNPEEYTNKVDYYQPLIENKVGPRRLSIHDNIEDMVINKISAKRIAYSNDEKAIIDLKQWFYPIIHTGKTIEFVPHGYSKATGARKLIKKLNIAYEDTYAFGDSMNDYDIISMVRHGIAMGGAPAALCEAAEFETNSVKNSGIPFAMKKLNLI